MEIKQEDIFVSSGKSEKIIEKSKGVPIGYVPVQFSSGDKLGPEILHFRNYSMGELFELTSVKEELQFKTLVLKVLNNMVLEDFDCSKLHMESIKEIMLSIYKNFWNSTLYNRPYFKDLKKGAEKENIGYVDINLQKITTIDIDESFKNKFTLVEEKTGKKTKFILPTVEHLFIAEETTKLMFAEKEKEFYDLVSSIELKNKLIESGEIESAKLVIVDQDKKEEYDEIIRDKNQIYYQIVQSQLIHSIDGVELTSIEDKLDAFQNKVDALAWIKYKEVVEEKANFGIDSSYSFPVDGETITRRFSFRPLVFIPPLDKKSNSRYTVQFDDWV